MADEMDDTDDEGTGCNPAVQNINGALLEFIGESVKLGILIAELPEKDLEQVQPRWAAFVSAVNQMGLKSPDFQKKKRNH